MWFCVVGVVVCVLTRVFFVAEMQAELEGKHPQKNADKNSGGGQGEEKKGLMGKMEKMEEKMHMKKKEDA